eukprot:2905381-Rhodomonas_salina.1
MVCAARHPVLTRGMCYATSGTDVRCAGTRQHRDRLQQQLQGSSTLLLCCYAFATQCAVLTLAMILRTCYATSGTDIGYAPRPKQQRNYPEGNLRPKPMP